MLCWAWKSSRIARKEGIFLSWENRAPATPVASAGRGCGPGPARAARAARGQRPPPRPSHVLHVSVRLPPARAPLGHHRAGARGAAGSCSPCSQRRSGGGGTGSSSEPRPHQARCAGCRVDFYPPEKLGQFSSGRNKRAAK